MQSVALSESHDPTQFQFFMLFRVAILPLPLMEKARSLSAKPGWQAYEEVTETLVYLAFHPFQKLYQETESFQKLERLTVVLYDKTSSINSVNEVRRNLFCQRNQAIDKLPPTQDALLQHVLRTVYQSGIWTSCTQTQPPVPTLEGYGWTKVADSWVPVWITVLEVSKACNELIKCSCEAECTRCKCAGGIQSM